MSKVRSKNTRPEILVRKFLHPCGFRYRLHSTGLPGSPDIALPKYKTVVFIHGCFWHQHAVGCGKKLIPRTNVIYWKDKLERNVRRDNESQQALREAGWRVLVVWECELKKASRGATLFQLITDIIDDEWQWEASSEDFV